MPVMHAHSLDDPRVPFDGGRTVVFPLVYTIRHPAVEDVVREWVLHDRCPPTPREEAPAAASNGHSALRRTWAPCAGGAEIVLWRLHGPGHV
jgi:poly(3-hydroxybutyrate) depolymerase